MIRSHVFPVTNLRAALLKTAGRIRETTVREASYGLAWRWLAMLGGLFLLDLMFALPVWLRWAGLLGQGWFVYRGVQEIRRSGHRAKLEDQRAARVVEESHPELDNALINAVQFEDKIDAAPEAQAPLMRREIERAESAIAGVSLEETVSRDGERRSFRKMAGFAGVWLLVAVLFPGAFFAVMPRLFAPWLDDITPPFSLTKFDVMPHGASVRFGDPLTLNISVSGPIPDNIVLMTRTKDTDWRSVALESTEAGHYAVTLDSLREDTWYCAQGGGARSARWLAKVILPPTAESITASYVYPRYVNRQSNTETVGDAGIHALFNTDVRLKISANRDLSGGTLTLTFADGETERVDVLVDPKSHRQAITTFRLTRSGKFTLMLAGDDNQVNPEAAKGKLTVEHDQHPTVWIDAPGQELLVTPEMKLAIGVEAEDDVGVQTLEIHRTINDLADTQDILHNGPPLKKVGSRLVMDLADLGVRPGDQITYYAAAYDNDPGRPNYAETDPYKLKVVSKEEYIKALKDQQDAERLSKDMQDIVEATQELAKQQRELAEKMQKIKNELAKKPGDAALQKQLQQAQAEQKELQQAAQEFADQLSAYAKSPSNSDLEAALKKKIGEMSQKIGQAAQGPMQQAQSGTPGEAADAAKKAAEMLSQVNGQMQQQVAKSIQNLEKVAPLFNDVERFKELLTRQGQLVLQARQFQDRAATDATAKARMDHIATEQEQIRQELQQLQQDFRAHATAAQKDFPKAAASARKIADEIGRRQIANLMQAGTDKFHEYQGPEGFQNAQRALQEMEAMMSNCQACQSNCEGELDIALGRSLGQSGLGDSLSQCMGNSPGTGQGGGNASGRGGMGGGSVGQTGGGYTMRGPMAYVPSVRSLGGAAGVKRAKNPNGMARTPAELAPDHVETMGSNVKTPPKASDAANRAYPPEYRKMINDYFISVSKEKR